MPPPIDTLLLSGAAGWIAAAIVALGVHVCLTLLLQAPRMAAGIAWRWRTGAGVALGTGLWAAQVLLMPAFAGGQALQVGAIGQALVWASAVALSLIVCDLAGQPGASLRARLGGIATMAAAAGALPLLVQSTAAAGGGGSIGPAGLLGLSLALALGAAACAAADRSGRHLGPARVTWATGASLLLAGAMLAPWLAGPPPALLGGLLAFGPAPAAESLSLLAGIGAPAGFLALLVGAGGVSRAMSSPVAPVDTDPLTDLPNREAMEAQLADLAQRAEAAAQRLGVLIVDVGGFRVVNESLGHATGDALLQAFAVRLRTGVGDAGRIGRLNGDKFIVLLTGLRDAATVVQRAALLVEGMQQPVRIREREFSLSCSVGVALYPDHGAASVLIGHAERAMAAAKRNGGATHCLFESSMAAPARDQVDLVRDLRRAIEHRELELFYQPKVHAPTGEITGAEALMRWRHPHRGMISPGVFIPIAERFGLIGALGNWLIDEACRQVRAWRDDGLRMRVAINLSVQQMRQEDVVERLRAALERHRINPRQITCEITETAAMDDAGGTKAVFERLEKLGVHISIDDFGTGYSSLAYLRKLRAEELKIDQSFVADLETSADARAIVDAVVKLALALGLKVVAEGVETEGQQRILRALGCNELQGYLFAKPMSAKSLALWAMEDIGPRSIAFRPSLFTETDAAPLDEFPPTRPQPVPSASRAPTSAPKAGRRNAIH